MSEDFFSADDEISVSDVASEEDDHPIDATRSQGMKQLRQLFVNTAVRLNKEQIDEVLEKLKAKNVFSIDELAAFPVENVNKLELGPKLRAVLKDLIPKLNESFRLKEAFALLKMFNDGERQPDYDKVAKILLDQLEIDSWASFFELKDFDLMEVSGLEDSVREEILEFIEFAKGFDNTKLTRDMGLLRNRRAHSPEDLKDILMNYETYSATINRALEMVSIGVPLHITKEELLKKKEQLANDRKVFEDMMQQAQTEEDDAQSELVSFNDDFELYLNDVLLSQMRQKGSSTNPAHVVTFVGATHAGKSTMIRQLVSPGKKTPAVAARGNYYPTTGNVHIYETDMNFLSKSYPPHDVNLIDIEGSNSPTIPKYILNTLLKRLWNDPSFIEKRRKAVNQHLPRFAYVISDVIVYIGEGCLSNTDYRDNVVAFANAAVENVASAIRPCLIIVHNKCNLHEPMDVEVMTKKFLQLHEPEEHPVLTRLYDSVKCISIPDWYHDQSLFDQQIDKLKYLIASLLDLQQRKRQRLGCLLTQIQWCDLIRYVVQNFSGKSLRIGTFVGELVSPENSLAKHAFNYFNTIYDTRSQRDPQNTGVKMKQFYLDCRTFAIEKLAVILLADLRKETTTTTFYVQQEEQQFPKTEDNQVLSQFQSEVLDIQLSKWYHVLEVLCTFIQNRAPCSACYAGVKDENDQPVHCTQEFQQHDAHRSPAMVYSPTKDGAGIIEQIIDELKKLLRIKIPSVWNGEFDFGSGFPSLEEDKALFRRKIESLQKMNAQQFFVENLAIVKKATIGKTCRIPEDVCFICQINRCNRRMVPCSHSFCEYCSSKMSIIKSDCPVCGTAISRAIIYEELSFKVGKVISKKGVDAVQKNISKIVEHPYKIVSFVGKIPNDFKSMLKTIEDLSHIAGGRLNPIRNFAFCSRFTGTKSCIYVEGDKEKLIIVHYAVDRYFGKPCIFPFLTSDVVILLDMGFAFRLPEGYPHHPFLIEPVISRNRLKIPHRLTFQMIMHYLSPPTPVQVTVDLSPSVASGKTSTTRSEVPIKQTKPIPIPKELQKSKSRYSLLEWCMATKEIRGVNHNFIVQLVYGADSFMKKRTEFFVYSTVLRKCIICFQLLEKKYAIIPPLLSQMTLINVVEAADKNGIELNKIKHLLLEILAICRVYLKNMTASAREYYSSPFGKSEKRQDSDYSILEKAALRGEIAFVQVLKERLNTRDTKRVVTFKRLLLYVSFIRKLISTEGKQVALELCELLAKNTNYCLLCIRGSSHKVILRRSLCDHSVCKDCWEDIEWIEARQHLVLEFIGKQQTMSFLMSTDETEPPPPQAEESNPASAKSSLKQIPSLLRPPNRSTSPGMPSPGRSRTTVEDPPSPAEKQNYRRSLLLFRCPICQQFLKDRLTDYISSDMTLSQASERSVRIQCVLSEVEQGEVVLHKQIQQRELNNLEPIVDSVYKAKYNNQSVAVKFFKPYYLGFEWPRFRREVGILAICSHPHIITFIGANVPDVKDIKNSNWQDSEESTLKPFIVLEYLPETLSEIIRSSHRKLPLNLVVRYLHQISTALQFLHSMNLVHRDIKPANIVVTLDSKTAKLIDFGESRIVSRQNGPLTIVGTPFYEAPEISNGIYTDKVDTYSFGKMFYEMTTKSVNPIALTKVFYEKPLDIVHIVGCPDDIRNLIESCCVANFHQRPDFDHISAQLAEIVKRHGTEGVII